MRNLSYQFKLSHTLHAHTHPSPYSYSYGLLARFEFASAAGCTYVYIFIVSFVYATIKILLQVLDFPIFNSIHIATKPKILEIKSYVLCSALYVFLIGFPSNSYYVFRM